MDNYYEQLVRSKETPKYIVARLGMIIFAVAAGFNLMVTKWLFALIFGIIALISFFIKKMSFVEYEYIFTNGDIDVDIIYDQNKRKRVFNFAVKDIELLALANSDEVKNFSGNPGKVLKCYPSTSKEKVYAAMINKAGKRFRLIFVPNEKFVGMCFKYNPKAVKRNV